MKSIKPDIIVNNEHQEETAKDILEKIKIINENISKPKKKHIAQSRVEGSEPQNALDEETLRKLQEMLKQGEVKLSIASVSDVDQTTAKARARTLNPYEYAAVSYQPILLPYPIMGAVMPASASYARQTPTLPFQIPWPLAPYFPILIKDPLLTFIQGGNFNSLFEYGQNADVCNRKHAKSDRHIFDDTPATLNHEHEEVSTREGKAIKKRTIQTYSRDQDIKTPKKVIKNKFINKKPIAQEAVEATEDTDRKGTSPDEEDGDLRMPFGDFGWFGNKKPVAPSPGFFINRLKVHRGGVAIAGPGGVATAGRGGTALVGPGGLAYTQPGGMAVAGPAARVVAVSEDTDMNDVISRLIRAQSVTGTAARKLDPLPDGKVVATGPVLYYHKDKH